ncbi:MAG TPA: phosphate ABC transporter permease PstA [Phycisphaerales bacterium]|nr:phosphate ABC transporter permease PstA [Phycisphaerales bacterium]HRQ76097.1 phosphate ABC transporter permease PstA [Phycisphaerales bacterium]
MSSAPARTTEPVENVPVVRTVPSAVLGPRSKGKAPSSRVRRKRTGGPGNSLYAQGEPMVWLTGGALAVCMCMIVGMILLIIGQGITTFWPVPIVSVELKTGESYMGEVTRTEWFTPGHNAFQGLDEETIAAIQATLERESDGLAHRRLVRTGNFELTNTHFHWVNDFAVVKEDTPEWAIIFERRIAGRFYGTPVSFSIDGEVVATDPAVVWREFEKYHAGVIDRAKQRRKLETKDIGKVNHREEQTRQTMRSVELRAERGQATDAQVRSARESFEEIHTWARSEHHRIMERIAALNAENNRYSIRMRTVDGRETDLSLADIVRAYPANQLGIGNKISIYFSRWGEFLTDDPREANSEGGVFPAIFGTVIMTLIMTIFVVPFGVLAALYLREYAKAGPIVSAVRVAINNLAGVPSIVFGVFGLGFLCYIVGGGIDNVFFPARVADGTPTYGKGGILWASLTLALLTLPVVIVATEEALAAVPGSMREGSYACGASKWQTIRRIVLPRAMPGIMTGMILAMARGAGEVAPLMLVGAVKLAPDLPIDGNWTWPFGPLHPERSFMHLGFHIYDVGFQSPNSEAAKPMVFTTTLLLICIIAFLNLAAIWLRSRLKRKFAGSAF